MLFTGAAMSVGFDAIGTPMAATAREVLADESRLGFLFAAIAREVPSAELAYGTTKRSHPRVPAPARDPRDLRSGPGAAAVLLA